MNKRVIQLIPSIILYVFAGLLAVYAIWAYSHWVDIISQLLDAEYSKLWHETVAVETIKRNVDDILREETGTPQRTRARDVAR